jgi:phosphopantetheine--protein transferase-like protein
MYRFRARTEDRLFDPQQRQRWLQDVTGMNDPNLHVEDRTLRVEEGQPDDSPTPPSGGSGGQRTTSSQTADTSSADANQTNPALSGGQTFAESDLELDSVAPDLQSDQISDEERERFKTEAILVEADTSAAYDPIQLKNRLEGRKIVILAGPMLVTNLMRRAAERCGAEVLVLEDSGRRSPLESDETVCNLTDEEALADHFDEFGPVDGLINLLGFGRADYSPEDVQYVARQTFHVARAWRTHLGGNPGRDHFMTTVTGMGGRLGFDRATSPLPVCGAVCGLTKGLAREWPDANVRVVDVPRDGLYPDLCQQILAETFSDVRSLEVGLLGGVRYLPVAVDSSEIIGHGAGDSVAPTRDSVILVTGGAKGITSRIAMDLARRFNCKLALVGRTELTYDDPLSIDMDEAKAEAERRIEDRGERVTPVRVRDELYPLKSQRTIQENMQAMTDLGAEVAYFSCDVSNADLVGELVEDVQQHFGQLDGVIHAAGVEDSKLIHDKDAAAFDKVFNAKAIGGLHLWNAVAELNPSFFITFSSVVARFGNAGQADYAGANEVLNKLAAQINATSDVHALSIDWTAWEDVGMAAGGSVETILRRNGVEFLPPAIGAPILGDALEQGLSGECMVAAELGKLSEGFDLRRSQLQDTDADAAAERPAFQGKVVETSESGDRLVVERVFDPERDRFLDDHVYEGQPVLPGVMGLEMMVETAEQLVGADASKIREVAFDRAVKLHHGDPIRVIATCERTDDGSVEVTLSSEREVKTGRTIERDHFTATVEFSAEPTDEPDAMLIDDGRAFDAGFDRPDIYRRFFHTGSFQVIESVAHLNDDAVIGYGRKPTDRAFNDRVNGQLVTDPMVREMAFQIAGIWGMVYNRQSYLPYAIGQTSQFDTAHPGETVCVRARRNDNVSPPSPEVSVISFDLEVRGQDGRLLQVLEDCQMVGHRKLNDDECFPAPDSRRMTLRRMSRPEADALLADRGLTPDKVLTRDEQRDWKRLRSDRRRGEWLAARIAAKDLACRFVLEFHGYRPNLEDIAVVKDDNGAPYLQWVEGTDASKTDLALPNVTVTHAEGVAIAAIAAPGTPCRVGVDLESVEERNESFADNYFTEDERAIEMYVGDRPAERSAKLTALWSVKEAVSKALGLGLKLALGEIIIEDLQQADGYSVAHVTLDGKAAEEAETLQARNLDVHVKLDGGFALASARLAVQEAPRQRAEGPDPINQKEEQATDQQRESTGNGHEAAIKTDEAKPRHGEFAAVAALLKHKGLLDAERAPTNKQDQSSDESDRSLPSWRS